MIASVPLRQDTKHMNAPLQNAIAASLPTCCRFLLIGVLAALPLLFWNEHFGSIGMILVNLLLLVLLGTWQGYVSVVRREILEDEHEAAFITSVSHQLRTPLASMHWIFERLSKEKEGTLTEKQMDLIQNGYLEALYMAKIIRVMLLIAQADRGKLSMKRKKTNISTLLESIAKTYDAYGALNGQHIVVECTERHVLNTDPSVFQEIIEYLLFCSMLYFHEGSDIILQIKPEKDGVRIIIKSEAPSLLIKPTDNIVKGLPGKEKQGSGIQWQPARMLVQKKLKGNIAFQFEKERRGSITLFFPFSDAKK